MQQIPHLKEGDKVILISTARKINKQELLPAVKVFENWGLKVVFGKNLFVEEHQFAGSTSQRATDLQAALDNKNIKAIFCVRGGYGTVKIIDLIDFSSFIQHPKWIVGYSDVTVLHNHINQNFNLQSLHATMPINFQSNTKESLNSLKRTLFGEKIKYDFESHLLNRKGQGQGELVGGNLSIIYSLTGTQSQLNTSGKLLFLEDLYRLNTEKEK